MSLYFLSLQATEDLQEINDYLFAGNPDIADRAMSRKELKFLANSESHLKMTK
ncbi:type II toxin-antitoxin system RelE/ParE family toxin [Nostoc sp. CHAB 5715]|uniref:type II toxin-antitoxin system RelE/ParE family toxin n=1 Tax=Nostoc sp. CHAB 5715 TaxID=2780400 RepID=UPI001E441F0F|nr:type II toxin-antitoxin system RelE/ParE family toxin [Nostoc sp. CHAB 5715]MCC5622466.1 type II toxin-antitoxin system RelE/ParE family toxin [Nostoc sp. CHAB 5715]